MTIVSKDWRLGPDTNTLDYSCSASIAAHGVAKIVDKGIQVRLNSVRNFQWSGSYRVAGESLPDDLLYDNFEDTAGRGGPWKSMRVEIRPAFGDTFVYGSTVISRAQVTGTFATHDRFLDGFYVIGPTKLFVFRASYGDADPKRLTDVRCGFFQSLRQVAKQALTTIANTRKRSYLPGLATPNGGFTSSTPSCIRRLVRSLRLTGLTSGELGLFGLVGSGQAGRHYEMSGLGSQRSGAVLLAGLANGPRTHHPWPAGLEVRYLPG
jgi:hypothetical protein